MTVLSKANLIAAMGVSCLIGVGIFAYSQRPVEANLEVVNAAPYSTWLEVRWNDDRNGPSEFRGSVHPGDSIKVTGLFRHVQPEFRVRAGAQGPLVRFLYGRDLPLGTFGAVDHVWNKRGEVFELVVPAPHPTREGIIDIPENLEAAKKHAKALAGVLESRRSFLARFGRDKHPYLVGSELGDDDEFAPGVYVAGTMERTPTGSPVNLAPGDWITGEIFNGALIYSVHDLQAALINTVETQGIHQAVKLKVMRGEDYAEGIIETGAYHNLDFWPRQENGALKAFLGAVADAVTLGFKASTFCSLSRLGRSEHPETFEQCRVRVINGSTLMASQHPSAYFWGSLVPIPFRIIRLPIPKSAGNVRRAATRMVGEAIEVGVLTAATAPAGVSRLASGLEAAPYGSGVGLATFLLSKKR